MTPAQPLFPRPDDGLREAAARVVAEWDALMVFAIEDGEQGVLFPEATVNLADAILPLRAALAATPPAAALGRSGSGGGRG